ncbi:MAG TPA: zinc-binding dehydrogenase [Gaiellales bacterium]|nr:zinc-binding dehydrogenase [Gaiellales bacterium]
MTVRAAVIQGPGRFAVEPFPDPDPAPGATVLRMHYSGICGTDKHTWRGESLQYAGTDHERDAAYPLICGHENVGVIEALGAGDPPLDEDGRPFRVGDRVVPAPNVTCGRCRFCLDGVSPYYLCTGLEDYGNSLSCAEPPHLFGGWSELMYILPGTRLFRVPDELPSELAALTEVMAVTHGLDTARVLAPTGGGFGFGATVLVLGVGPLGLMHLAKAELLGAGLLIAVDVLAERLEHARAFGAELCLDASAATPEDRRAAVREATAGLGADVVVDCSGRAETFPEALGLARPGGAVIEAGAFVDLGPIPVNPNRDICTPGLTILGIGGEVLPQYAPALRMLARHRWRLPLARAITHRVPLDGVGEALETAQTGAAMKMLVAPNGAV